MSRWLRVFLWAAPLFILVRSSALTIGFAAENAPQVRKVGVVSLNRLMGNYQGAKSSVDKLRQIGEGKQQERERIVSEIKKMRQGLELLNEEARSKRQQQMEEKMKELAQFDREARTLLLKEQEQERDVVFREIEAVVSAFAKEKGFDLVLNDQAVLYGTEGLDITDQVLGILNERYAKKRP